VTRTDGPSEVAEESRRESQRVAESRRREDLESESRDDSVQLQTCGVGRVSNTKGRPGLDGAIKHGQCDPGEAAGEIDGRFGCESVAKLGG
jgi:hypothetical protein